MYLSKRFAHLPPKKKLRARIALYLPILGVVAALLLSTLIFGRIAKSRLDQSWTLVDYAALPEVQLLQDYIRIDTSPTTGSELAGAEFLAARLSEAGLEPHIQSFGDGRANLWAVLEGESPEALVLHSHIDVTPANIDDGWDFPPYEGIIDKAWIYGRGAFDMKSVAIAQLLAITDLKKSGRQPKRSVIFLATGSEESGSYLGTSWILRNYPQLVERFWAVLTEGGVIESVSLEEVKYWGVEFAQKWFAAGWVCSPNRDQLEAMKKDIEELNLANFELTLYPEVLTFFEAYAASRLRKEYTRAMDDTQEALNHPTSFYALPPYIKSMFREELAVFPVEEDPEGGYRMKLIFHLFGRSDLEEARRVLLPEWLTHGATVTVEEPMGSGATSPIDSPVFETIVRVVNERFPDAKVGPYFLPWSATDSRFFRQNGIPSYGFSPFLVFATDTFRHDEANERLGLPGYVSGIELYRDLVTQLVN